MGHNAIRDNTVNNNNNRVINSGNTNTNSNNIDISGNMIMNYNIIAATVALNASNNANNGALDSASVYSHDFKVVVKLPFRRNPNFCGRLDLIEKLQKILEPRDLAQHSPNTLGNSSGRKTAVLYGMGGVGKSQIALEYAHRFVHSYTSILWIDSDAKDATCITESACKFIEQLVAHYVSRSGSDTDYQAISKIMGIPGKIDSSGKIIKTATEFAIGTVQTWLAAEENRGWLLLVDNHDKAEVEELEELIPTCDWGSVLVTTRCPTLNTFGELVEAEKIGAEAGLELLLKSLVKYKKPLSDTELEKAKEIVRALGELPLALDQAGAYVKFRQIHFSTYLDRLEKGMEASLTRKVQGFGLPSDKASVLTTWKLSFDELNEDAQRLLCLCAFLSNEDIPEELFSRGISAVDWLKDMEGSDNEKVSSAAFTIGETYDGLEYYKNAEALYQIALTGREKVLGMDHRLTLDAVNSMAAVFNKQGRYNEALKCYERGLAGYEMTLGKDHADTMRIMNNMAIVFDNQGRYEESLEYYERTLEGKENVLGKDHPSTLGTVNNMAIVFDNLRQYDEALELYQRVLAGEEKKLGEDHPTTLDTVNNIALVFNKYGCYDKALEYYQRALAGYEKVLGKDHPSALKTIHNMAMVFDNQGLYDEALDYYQIALAGLENALGNDHPSTLNTMHGMAILFNNQGRHDEVLECYQRALAGYEKSLGKDHPDTLRIVNNMASFFNNRGRYDEALHLKRLYACE
ncbi:hypothetical protein RUND412_009974 [Rhizina undulata]